MSSWLFCYFVLCVFLFQTAGAVCPNHCNGNGLCDKYGRCECSSGYTGADCSERICPSGSAWADQSYDVDKAHSLKECSNRGICDRSTGVCQCMEGFTGSACERLSCNLGCNEKGRCMSMRDFSSKTRNEYSASYEYLQIWDAEKIQGCVCDFPNFGYDCSQRQCPGGDDPLTVHQVNEVQLLRCVASQGSFVLYYNGLPSSNIPFTTNVAYLKKALLRIPSLTGLKVTSSSGNNAAVCDSKGSSIVSIEFTEQFGSLHPLVAQIDQSMMDIGGFIEISADGFTTMTSPITKITYKSVKGSKENDICSNRGICDENTGVCDCYDTNGDVYGSSDGYAKSGSRGDCGFVVSSSEPAISTCPGTIQCSGHGVCDTTSHRCYCAKGWASGDCSEKTCPQGRSWFSYPQANDVAHFDYVECANMGLCDKTSGKCKCRPGFYGEACEYMTCGGPYDNSCNGHGRCMTMAELALWANNNGDATDFTYGSDPNNPLTWDHDRVHGCLCDTGFDGYDCSLKLCPFGDDPGTYDDHSEVQILQCIAEEGNFTLTFRQHETVVLSHNVTVSELTTALLALPSVENIEVFFLHDGNLPNGTLDHMPLGLTRQEGMPVWGDFIGRNGSFEQHRPNITWRRPDNSSFCSVDGKQLVFFHFTYTHGDVPALQPNTTFLFDFTNGNGGFSSGQINVFDDGKVVQGFQSIRGTTENELCNNRGLCDLATGQCKCFESWTSSDGKRQGGAGDKGDCGYRNDKKYSYFNSIEQGKA